MLPQLYFAPKMNLIAHLERFICLFKKRFEVQKNQWFFTLRDVIFWVILIPLLKKCTFFSFKNHISVSNCRMKLIFDSGEFWDSIFCKNKIFEKGGTKGGAGVWIWNDWVATLKNMNFISEMPPTASYHAIFDRNKHSRTLPPLSPPLFLPPWVPPLSYSRPQHRKC